jgi:hypothetical protein
MASDKSVGAKDAKKGKKGRKEGERKRFGLREGGDVRMCRP